MSDIKLEDFIVSYPSIADPKFEYKIAQLQEFNELYLKKDQTSPEENKRLDPILLPHQLFAQRFFSPNTPYKEGLLWHEPGTGKTCVMSAIVEIAKTNLRYGIIPRSAIIFVPSDEIRRNHYKDISDKCTDEIYTAKYSAGEHEPKGGLTEEGKRQRINRAVRESYEILTYDADLTKIKEQLKTPEGRLRLKNRFNGRTILLDEAHSIRMQSRDFYRDKPLEEEEEVDEDEGREEVEEEDDEDEIEEKTKIVQKSKKDKSQYNTIHEFLHFVNYEKLLLFTGTPIWDKTNEIASLLNLMLSTKEQLPPGKKFEKEFFELNSEGEPSLRKSGKDILEKILKGKIFYLRQHISDVKRIENGVTKPWLKYTKVYPSIMSDHQSDVAIKAKEEVKAQLILEQDELLLKSNKKDRNVKGGPVLSDARQAAEFVFEDGTYGQEGFKKHVIVKGTPLNPIYLLDEIHKKAINRGTTVAGMDIEKKNEIRLKNLKKYSTKYTTIINLILSKNNESVFVYSGDFVKGGGAILFALVLQEFGFSKTSGIDPSKPDSNKAQRFGIITSNPWTTHESTQVGKLLENFNHRNNRYGEYIRVIIGSKKISVGLTLKNVRQSHATMASFNKPSMDQAFGRVFRYFSHDDFEPEERYLNIYRHIAVEGTLDGNFSSESTIDVHLYKIAEAKEHKNVQIYRILKEIAVDCAENYQRNVLNTDTPGSRECDHGECGLKCHGWEDVGTNDGDKYEISPSDRIYSNYNSLYSSRRIRKIEDNVIELFRVHFSLHLNALLVTLNIEEENKILLLIALNNIIDQRTPIQNRYGFKCFLKEQADFYFLDFNIDINTAYSENIYASNPYVTQFTSLDDLINIKLMKKDAAKLCEFIKEPTLEVFNELSLHTKSFIFEYAYLTEHVESYSGYKKQLNSILEFAKEQNIFYKVTDPNGEKRSVHILYTTENTGLSYTVTATNIKSNGQTRIFNPKTNSWEWVTSEIQEKNYIKEIVAVRKNKIVIGFEDNQYGMYGTVSKTDGKFRIHLKVGNKGKPRGHVCETETKSDNFRIFYQLKHLPHANEKYDNFPRQKLITSISSITVVSKYKDDVISNPGQFSDEELKQILTLLTLDIKGICNELKKWFDENQLLFSI